LEISHVGQNLAVTTPPPPGPPPEPPPDEWPTRAEPGYVADETVVQPAYAPEPAAAVPPPEEPDTRIGKGLLLGLLAVALVAGAILAYYLLTRDDSKQTTTTVITTTPTTAGTVDVPRVVGLKEQEALVRLGNAGLRAKEQFKPTQKPQGLVVSQNPGEATKLKRGAQVTIVIDAGAPSVAVPDVKGLSLAAATAKLDAAGLQATQTTVTSTEKAGTVVDVAPAAGQKVKKGSTITLSVAKAAPVAVPDVVGSTQADAQAKLEDAGFKVNAATVPSSKAKGQVVAQNPATGTKALPGSAVRINVSSGAGAGGGSSTGTSTASSTGSTTTSAPTTATVPNVVGMTEAEAAQALGKAGILASVVFVPSDDPLGQVEQQAKPEGATVPRNAHVQINLSRGPGDKSDVSVPNVVGKTLQDAVATLNGASLRLIYVKLPVTTKSQAGKVVQQTPLSGAQAPENAQVIVYLGAFTQ
jgi:beta-lactam-binding protein with PASTA domain